jgi:hypothetical protein
LPGIGQTLFHTIGRKEKKFEKYKKALPLGRAENQGLGW